MHAHPHQAGARLFCVGFESGDVEVINGMKKNNDDRRDAKYHDEAFRFVLRCRQAGIMVHGCFMVGNLNETPASMEKTLSFAKKLRLGKRTSDATAFARRCRLWKNGGRGVFGVDGD